MIPLHLHSKHVVTYKELLSMTRTATLISFSPEVNLLLATMEQRKTVLALCRSSLHMELLQDHLLESLLGYIQDPANNRYYNAAACHVCSVAFGAKQRRSNGRSTSSCCRSSSHDCASYIHHCDSISQSCSEVQPGWSVEKLIAESDSESAMDADDD